MNKQRNHHYIPGAILTEVGVTAEVKVTYVVAGLADHLETRVSPSAVAGHSQASQRSNVRGQMSLITANTAQQLGFVADNSINDNYMDGWVSCR